MASLTENFAVFANAKDVEIREGRRVRMLTIEPANAARVVLFVHGSMASMQQYEVQINHFNDGKTKIIAWDWFGCGDSPKPDVWEPYSCDELYLDVRAVFDKFCVSGDSELNVVAIGHSMGSLMCVRLAADLQKEVNESSSSKARLLVGLGLLGGCAELKTVPPIFMLPVFVLNALQPTLNGKFKELALHKNTLTSEEEHHRRIVARLEAAPRANPMYVCKAYYRQLSQPTKEQIKSVRIPAIVIHGDSDLLIPPAAGKDLADLLGGSENNVATYNEVKLASHQLMMEQPGEVNALLDGFCNFVFK